MGVNRLFKFKTDSDIFILMGKEPVQIATILEPIVTIIDEYYNL